MLPLWDFRLKVDSIVLQDAESDEVSFTQFRRGLHLRKGVNSVVRLDTAARLVIDSDAGIAVGHIGDNRIQSKTGIVGFQECARLSFEPGVEATLVPYKVVLD